MKLLEKINVGNITLKNRVMFPPLTTGYEEKDGSIGEQSLNFYKRLAMGGVSYVVIGDVVPIPTFSPTPKLYSDEQIPSFKKLADTLHQYDCKVGVQIFHPEYDAFALMQMFKEGKRDELYAKLHYDMLHYVNEVNEEQITRILDSITACVKRAIKAGIDVIEVHGDRLVGSLCSTILNKRNDEYGGSFENRIRFALKVVDAIKKASDTITIEYKLPIVTRRADGSLQGKGGLVIEEAVEFAKILEAHGVNMIHVAQANHTGNMNDTIPAMGMRRYAFMTNECKMIKDAVDIPVSMVGRIVDVDMANRLLENNICDIVALGRPLLADPDIINKTALGQQNLIRKCIMCNKGCTDAIQSRRFLSCVLNPENGYEFKREITMPTRKHKVAVVGAGIAGLEAARVLALKGHDVTVYEKSDSLYGQLRIASVPPRKEEMNRICGFYDAIIKEYNINILYNHEFTALDAKGFEDIIVAVGARNAHPGIKGIDNAIDSWDVLAKKAFPYGRIAICGGGLVGVECAEYLINRGYDVTIIEMQDRIAKEESNTILPTILEEFKKYNVKVLTNTKIEEIGSNYVLARDLNNEEVKIECETVINALASKKNTIDLSDVKANILYVGDCKDGSPCSIETATKTAYDAANSIN